MTLLEESNSILINMKAKESVIFDISSEKFKYLHREDKITKRVNIVELNKKLNQTKKTNLYSNTISIVLLLLALIFFAIISLKF